MTDFLEIYIHIPFCVKKCNYCDFLSAPADRETQRSYMEALLKEIAGRAVEARGKKVVSIFIGGGTPSIVEPKLLASVVEQVKGYYAVAEDAEITMELNPGTADEEALVCYLEAGINRLSIGLQSTVDTELKTLGRIHTFEQFLKVYEMARKVGFVNVNADLMSAIARPESQLLSPYVKDCDFPDAPAGAYFCIQPDRGGGNCIWSPFRKRRIAASYRRYGTADV